MTFLDKRLTEATNRTTELEIQLAASQEQVRTLQEALNEVHLSAVQYKHRARASKVYSIGQFDWPKHFGFIAETARAALAASEPTNG